MLFDVNLCFCPRKSSFLLCLLRPPSTTWTDQVRASSSPYSIKGCFLGYGIEHKGYRCWDPLSKRLRISQHVIFWEQKMFSSMPEFHLPSIPTSSFFTDCSVELFPDNLDTGSLSTPTATVSSEVPALSDGPTTDVQTESPRNSTRVSKPPVYLHDYYCFSTILSQHDPQSYREVPHHLYHPWKFTLARPASALRLFSLRLLGEEALRTEFVTATGTSPPGWEPPYYLDNLNLCTWMNAHSLLPIVIYPDIYEISYLSVTDLIHTGTTHQHIKDKSYMRFWAWHR